MTHDADSELAQIFASYIDRLNQGETLDADEIRAEHADIADELIDQLRDFEAFADSEAVIETKQFGPYRIVSELGRGGMGVVYDAFEESMDRRVALKVLPAGLMIDEKSVERFRREAKIAGKLNHPNIVAVYGTGIIEDTPFIAMELVEGESLDRVLDRKRPTPENTPGGFLSKLLPSKTTAVQQVDESDETLVAPAPSSQTQTVATPAPGRVDEQEPAALDDQSEDESWTGIPSSPEALNLEYCISMTKRFAAVAEGLHHAHEKGIVHRDLKPSNLILEPDGQIRVLDFGLARLEGQDHLTFSGEIVGTPRYMSPEQARSAGIKIDQRTDIFSFGATLFEVLTLTPPFGGQTAQETISAILTRDPRPLRQINPRVPKDLETIVEKCLRKKPEDRYSSSEALAKDLRAFTRGDPISARPMSFAERNLRRLRNNWKTLVAASLLVIAAIAIFEFKGRFDKERQQHDFDLYDTNVLEAFDKIQRSGAYAEKTVLFTWELAGYDMDRVTKGMEDPIESMTHLDEPIEELRKASKVQPDRPDAYLHLATAHWLRGEADLALSVLEKPMSLGFAPAFSYASTIHRFFGRIDKSRELEQKAREAAEGWAKPWLEMEVAVREKRWDDLLRHSDEFIRIEARDGRAFVGSSVEAQINRGIANLNLSQFDEASKCFAIASGLRPSAIAPGMFRAATYYMDGKKDLAEKEFQDLYARSPSADLATWIVMLYVARFQDFDAGQPWISRLPPGYMQDMTLLMCTSGKPATEESLAAARRLPKLKPDAPLSYIVAGSMLMTSGHLDEAEKLLEEAKRLAPESSVPYTMLSYVKFTKNEPLTAFMFLQKAKELEPDSAMVHFYLGQAYLGMKNYAEAEASLKRSLELNPQSTMVHDARAARLGLGTALQAQGKHSEAVDTFGACIAACDEGERLAATARANLATSAALCGRHVDAVLALGRLLNTDDRWIFAAGFRSLLRSEVRKALPDLPSFRSIDVALELAARDEIIALGATWRYFIGREAPSPELDWTHIDFDDAAWLQGPTGIGFADEDDATVLEKTDDYTTVFARHAFDLEASQIRDLRLDLRVDDGFVAYMNGKEISRRRVGPSAIIAHTEIATLPSPEPLCTTSWRVPKSMLRSGRNVLAIVGVNRPKSSDFSLIPELYAPRPARVEDIENLAAAYQSVAAEQLTKDPKDRGGVQSRLAYLQGRKHALKNDPGSAVTQFMFASTQNDDVEPLLARVASLRVLKKFDEAEEALRQELSTCSRSLRVWQAWSDVCGVNLELSASQILERFPCQREEDSPKVAQRYFTLLHKLSSDAAFRVDCGSSGTRSDGWLEDQFFIQGQWKRAIPEEARPELSPSNRRARFFAGDLSRGAYSVPLPSGDYEFTVHLVEPPAGSTQTLRFGIDVEENAWLKEVDLSPQGNSQTYTWTGRIDDGSLDLSFRQIVGDPEISGFEIRALPLPK